MAGQKKEFNPIGPKGGFGVPAEKAKDFKTSIKRLSVYLKPQIPILSLVVVFAIISTVFTIIAPKMLAANVTNPLAKAVATKYANEQLWNSIFRFIIIISGLYFISALFSFISGFVSSKMAQSVVFNLRQDIKIKLEKLPVKFFDNHSTGNVLSVITNDVDTISATLQQSLTQIITSLITLVGVFIMMLTISVYLTLITVICLPIFALITGMIMKKSQKQFVAQQATLGELNGHIEEMLSGQKIVKMFGKEEQSIQTFDILNDRLSIISATAQFLSGLIHPIIHFINNIGYVLVVIVGGVLAGASSPLLLGDILAFVQYYQSFSQPIMQTAQITNIIQSTIAAAERVFSLLDEEEEIENPSPKPLPKITGDVCFENVDFSYVKEQELMKNLTLNVKSGDSIAIVGKTGAGKTTLVNLLMAFYEIDGGKITIDGEDIREYSKKDLRSLYGMVLQDTWLFSGTVRDNIKYGNQEATDEMVIEAARKAHIHHFIETLPDGYDTVLNENAGNISQGQKQLLTIARAIISDPKILILDEATSSVDTRTEEYIQNAMTAMQKGKTSFVIAHRLSTIKNANLILVMDKGTIVEQGTHQVLLNKNGIYAGLYNSQFAKAN